MRPWKHILALVLVCCSSTASANCDLIRQMAEAGLVESLIAYPLKPDVSELDDACFTEALAISKEVKARQLSEEARAYLALGDRESARARLTQALELTPSDPTIAAALAEARATPASKKLSKRLVEASTEIDATALFIAKYGLLLLLGVLLIPRAWRWFFGRGDRQLNVEKFDVRGFEDDLTGEALVDTFLHRYQTLTEANVDNNVDVIVAPSEPAQVATNINKVLKAHSSGSVAGALAELVGSVLQTIRLRTVYTLSGEFHNVEGRGVGATVRLIRNSRVIASETLWIRDFQYGPQDEHFNDISQAYRLTDYLATWLQFTASSAESGKPIRILQTTSWRGYALFLASQYAAHHGRSDEAQILAEKALILDPDFHSVRANLARFIINRTNNGSLPTLSDEDKRKQRKVAAEHFETIRNACKQEYLKRSLQRHPPVYSDTVYYTATYGLAFLAAGETTQTIKHIRQFEDEFETALARSEHSGLIPLNAGQQEKIRSIYSSFKAIEAIALAEQGNPSQRDEAFAIVEEQRVRSGTSPMHAYNLACAYSLLSAHRASDKQAYEDKALALLRAALLREPNLIESVAKDKDLKSLRDSRSQEIKEIVAISTIASGRAESPKPPTSELERFSRIGKQFAQKLIAQDIETPAAFLEAGRTQATRLPLVSALGITQSGLVEMLQQVELTRIMSLDHQQANALLAVGVGSLEALARSHPRSLTAELDQLPSEVRGSPIAMKTTQQWINDAKNNTKTRIQLP